MVSFLLYNSKFPKLSLKNAKFGTDEVSYKILEAKGFLSYQIMY
jgi:hypothetical protein